MTVQELIDLLQAHDPLLPVRLTWSHGAEPGAVTDVRVCSYQDKTICLKIRGEQP